MRPAARRVALVPHRITCPDRESEYDMLTTDNRFIPLTEGHSNIYTFKQCEDAIQEIYFLNTTFRSAETAYFAIKLCIIFT